MSKRSVVLSHADASESHLSTSTRMRKSTLTEAIGLVPYTTLGCLLKVDEDKGTPLEKRVLALALRQSEAMFRNTC